MINPELSGSVFMPFIKRQGQQFPLPFLGFTAMEFNYLNLLDIKTVFQ